MNHWAEITELFRDLIRQADARGDARTRDTAWRAFNGLAQARLLLGLYRD